MADEPRLSPDDIDRAPDFLSGQSDSSGAEYDPTLRRRHKEVADENFELKEEIARLKQELRSKEAIDSLMEPNANRAYWFMCIYCGIVALIVIAAGFSVRGFSIPETVLVYLVGSTAATVIGLVGMVLTGIFLGARRR